MVAMVLITCRSGRVGGSPRSPGCRNGRRRAAWRGAFGGGYNRRPFDDQGFEVSDGGGGMVVEASPATALVVAKAVPCFSS
jgi:hypothetical protein